MIDIHSHPLPGLDDGAANWEMALAMARQWVAEGVRQVVATPHWSGATGEIAATRERLSELRERLRQGSLDLALHLGQEVVLTPALLDHLRGGTALSIANSSYILLETAQLPRTAYIDTALFQLQSQGYRVILAHPERAPAWQAEPRQLEEFLWRGCRLQVNAGSLLGHFGWRARRTAEHLLRRGWVSLIASDAHSDRERPPCLGRGFNRCASLVGEHTARTLCSENPARILCDEHLPEVRVDASQRGLLARLLMRESR